MNKENKSNLEALLEKVAIERDLEIYGLNIQTNQNPIVIKIIFTHKEIFSIEKFKNLYF